MNPPSSHTPRNGNVRSRRVPIIIALVIGTLWQWF
jgi:hypothetical protein